MANALLSKNNCPFGGTGATRCAKVGLSGDQNFQWSVPTGPSAKNNISVRVTKLFFSQQGRGPTLKLRDKRLA